MQEEIDYNNMDKFNLDQKSKGERDCINVKDLSLEKKNREKETTKM